MESATGGAIRVDDGERTPPPAATYSESDSVASVVEVVLGETIGRYQVRRLLGQGGMGRVYLARDVVLGRAIALKVVIGALLHEARVIAQLNHPNIVQLHDSGEHRGGIYLALEYVDGTTLRDRMTHGGVGADEALRYALAIADALAHAHAAGIYHCDLKPSNVIVGRDGRIRVLDFGIARTADDTGGATSGTEAWMAPEQSAGAALTDRVDSWALAIVATQLLTGGHPLGDTPARRQEAVREPSQAARAHLAGRAVPAVVADLIVRALSRDPRARPSAVEWKRAFDDVLNGRADALAEECPFPGLASFDERHARFYFGREREIDEFLERLRDAACLPIVGPSGTGKSSFLHAGVIPRLRARESWTVLSFRPGADPLGALARHVLAAGTARPSVAGIDLQYKQQIQALRAELLATPTLLAARLATLGTALGSSVLLAVDQLEEVFTQCESAVERDRFLEMLLGTANDPLDPVRVVFTVRDDFVGKIAGLRTLFVLHKPRREDLWRTIVHPLTRCRYELDDSGIVDDLLSEIGTAEADLPLLQFACRTLWEGRDVTTRRLRRSTYEDMGGLAGALARHAERALAELTPDELRVARGLLLRLVSGAATPSHEGDIRPETLRSAAEDRGAVGGTTRRAVARDQLVMTVGSSAEAVLDRLLAARLLAQRTQGDDESPIIEIAHESLLRTWAQLARWLAESRDERRLLDELQDTVSLWERRGARLEETWPQDDIAAVRRRAGQLALALPGHLHAFLAAGEARHRAHQRRRRVRYGMALALATAIAVPAFIWIGRYLEREHLIRTNAGTVDIVFRMYDSQAETPVPVAIAKVPELRWTLHAAKPGNPHEAGEPIPQQLIETLADSSTALERRLRIRAPGGTHFLRIDGRGGRGETCEPSWIRIQSFPGYAGDASPEAVAIDVPTCAASRADMLVVEAGEFIYGGPGEVASTHYGERDYDDPERRIDLPQFAMDKTELSNARFAMFGRLERVTGYPAPQYSDDAFHVHDRDPTYPVTDINLFEAEAYCRYMGKTLPTQLEWVKAARGGLRINGAPNPYPRRLFPWGPNESSRCANQAGSDDGNAWTAPVTSYNGDACTGPYGHLNLVGNVDEWMAREAKSSGPHGLAVIRGGSANSPPKLQHISTIYVNQRDPQWFDYAIGFRCVTHD